LEEKYRLIRTALFVPGNRPERVDKAFLAKADLVIIDLEDAVPLSQKREARSQAARKIVQHTGKKVFVRVNALNSGFFTEDLEGIVDHGLVGIMVPKTEAAQQVREIHALLLDEENSKGITAGKVELLLLIETAMGIERVFEIARESRIINRSAVFAFGAADFCMDLGIAMTSRGEELLFPRARMAIACRAADVPPPLDTPYMIDLKDAEGLEADAKRAKQLGFQGKLCVHPNQVDICNRVFSPTKEEIAFARRVVDAFQEAENTGVGAIQVDGKFVDPPIVKRAKRILQMEEGKL
jgi:citrate lyase subunit beta/citryl-CoA lyase